MLKKYTILALASAFVTQAQTNDVQIGARLGVNISSYIISTHAERMLGNAYTTPGGELAIDIERKASEKFSFGASTSLGYNSLDKSQISSIQSGVYGFYNISPKSQIGLGTNIYHAYNQPLEIAFKYGNYHRLTVGLKLRNYLTTNIYTNIELNVDASPTNYQSYAVKPTGNPIMDTLICASKFDRFSTLISVGYVFNEDSY